MNILVTGGAGYLGSILIPKLLVRGHQVRSLDIGYFGVEHIRSMRPTVDIVRDDIRAVLADSAALDRLLDGIDVVIHLAAISNDPSAELNPRLTEEVNFEATPILLKPASSEAFDSFSPRPALSMVKHRVKSMKTERPIH